MDKGDSLDALSRRFEQLLQRQGILDEQGDIPPAMVDELSLQLQLKFRGLLANMVELRGLIEVGRDVRRGKLLSAAVVGATQCMMEEVCHELEGNPQKQ